MDVKDSARAVIEDGNIVIRVATSALQVAVDGGYDLGGIDCKMLITDADAFAKEMVSALNDEDEQGTSPIHRLLDAAVNAVLNDGGEGFDVQGDGQ